MNAGEKRCSCSTLQYRNNEDGSRDYRIAGKAGCQKCHGIGIVRQCDKCAGCGMVPGSQVCNRCNGHGVTMGLAVQWSAAPPVQKGKR